MTIWRTFRLISIIDGVDVHENMKSCILVGVTNEKFWRDWHSSFN